MAESTKAPELTRLEIRKYPNRRYYDSTRSRHVTLEQIHALIREGYEIQVIDSKSEQDITAKVLAQIILELDPPKLGVFSVPMLHRLLQSNQELVSEFVNKYMNQPLMAFFDSQRSMEEYFRQALGMQNPASLPTDWAKAMWGPFNPAFWAGAKPGAAVQQAGSARPSPVAPSPTGTNGGPSVAAPAGDTVNRELLDQIESLRKQVSELRSGSGAKPAKASKSRGRRGR